MTRPPEPAFFEGSTGCLQCGGTAEPEQDGDVIYFACKDESCGAEFGHRRAVQSALVCAAGLTIVSDPAQPPGVMTVQSGSDRRSVFLGDVIRRRPE